MEILSLDEIPDWKAFERLVAAYFNAVKSDNEFNVTDVLVQATGSGSDGGRDILVSLFINDSFVTYERKWVVQCKFYNKDIGKRHLADVNIPSLLHQYGADGYLLVCKNYCTSPVTNMFEELRRNCLFKRQYLIWRGDDLIRRVRVKSELIEHYFPKYNAYLSEKERRGDQILNAVT